MEVWTLVVFESGEMEKSVWGVYSTKEKAEKAKEETLNTVGLNSDGCYLEVSISKHIVE